jgi:hypothetical protein
MGGRPRRADREDSVRRTVYVSDIDQHVSILKIVAFGIAASLSMLFHFLLLCR